MQLSIGLQGVISQTLLPKVGGGRVAAHEVMVCLHLDRQPDPRSQDPPDGSPSSNPAAGSACTRSTSTCPSWCAQDWSPTRTPWPRRRTSPTFEAQVGQFKGRQPDAAALGRGQRQRQRGGTPRRRGCARHARWGRPACTAAVRPGRLRSGNEQERHGEVVGDPVAHAAHQECRVARPGPRFPITTRSTPRRSASYDDDLGRRAHLDLDLDADARLDEHRRGRLPGHRAPSARCTPRRDPGRSRRPSRETAAPRPRAAGRRRRPTGGPGRPPRRPRAPTAPNRRSGPGCGGT